MSSLLEHCHDKNWKSPTRSFGRSGKAKRTFQERETAINRRYSGRYKWACSPTTNGIVQTSRQQEVGKRVGKTDF